MAKMTHTTYVDDLDKSPAAENIIFALDGVTYEIDLSEENAQKFRADLAVWVEYARRVPGRKGAGRKAVKGSTSDVQKIRAWAQANGMQVSARGRVSAEIKAAYEAANA